MPGFVLNVASTVLCAHGGQAKAIAPNPRVLIAGSPVVTQLAPYVIAGCPNLPSPTGVGPCITGTWITASLRVKSMGQPLLLQDSQGICVPTGTPLTVALTQPRVKAL
jgi:hypothetical protein